MSRVVERQTGATVLPPSGDERATVSAWAASLACDADLRARVPEYRALAETLGAVAGPEATS